MMDWFNSILGSLAALLVSPATPSAPDANWVTAKGWDLSREVATYSAASETLIQYCKSNPGHYLVTDIVPQGVHEFFVTEGPLKSSAPLRVSGDALFGRASTLYNIASVECAAVAQATAGMVHPILTWKLSTQTKTLTSFSQFPYAIEGYPFREFFISTIHMLMLGLLLAIFVVAISIFHGKIEASILNHLILMCLSLGIGLGFMIPDSMHLGLSPLTNQKLIDPFIWFGMLNLYTLFERFGICSNLNFRIVRTALWASIFITLTAASLDHLQVGSNLAFAVLIPAILHTLGRSILALRNHDESTAFRRYQLIAAAVSALFCVNEPLIFFGVLDTVPLFPIGAISAAFVLLLAVNERVTQTYKERDYLRENLQLEVERKTLELKATQADLVQSAKLASLGTLSAGIAHEINNALNFVNGSIKPLERILENSEITPESKSKSKKLMNLMTEGLELTFGIIKNLKDQTRGTPGEKEVVPLKEFFNGLLLVLKNKVTNISVELDIDPTFEVFGSKVGLSQAFMNLVVNAADAIEDHPPTRSSGKINIAAQDSQDFVLVKVSDNGKGMPPEVRERIFDPFFTTKAPGKGTGLGLHIVMNEVKREGGRIEVTSTPNVGTEFSVYWPKKQLLQKEAA